MSKRRKEDIAYAVHAIAALAYARGIAVSEAIAIVSSELDDVDVPGAAAPFSDTRRAKMLAEFKRLEDEGCDPHKIVGIVASRFARHSGEVENLARNLRRWLGKNPDTVRLPSPR